MILYSIRHKISGKWLVNVHPATDEYWTKSRPHFWTTIDGIIANLKKLAGEKITPSEDFHKWYHSAKPSDIRANGYHVYWTNFDYSKLINIEVICTNV